MTLQNDTPLDLPGFDLTGALARLDGNRDLLIKILLKFAQDYVATSSQVNTLLQDEQRTKAAFLLHRIRGAALMIGVNGLAQSAQQLESEITTGALTASENIFAKQLDDAVQTILTHIPPHQNAA